MRTVSLQTFIRGSLTAFGILVATAVPSSSHAFDSSADMTGIPFYRNTGPGQLLIGRGPDIDQLVTIINLGTSTYTYRNANHNQAWIYSDSRGSAWVNSHEDEYKSQPAIDQPLLNQLMTAFENGYSQKAAYKPTDLSCMRNGLNGFELHVTFNDGTSALVTSSLGAIIFNDVGRIITGVDSSHEQLDRLDVPDQQLIDHMHLFGVLTTAAYADPCTNTPALQQLSDGSVAKISYQLKHLNPSAHLTLTPSASIPIIRAHSAHVSASTDDIQKAGSPAASDDQRRWQIFLKVIDNPDAVVTVEELENAFGQKAVYKEWSVGDQKAQEYRIPYAVTFNPDDDRFARARYPNRPTYRVSFGFSGEQNFETCIKSDRVLSDLKEAGWVLRIHEPAIGGNVTEVMPPGAPYGSYHFTKGEQGVIYYIYSEPTACAGSVIMESDKLEFDRFSHLNNSPETPHDPLDL